MLKWGKRHLEILLTPLHLLLAGFLLTSHKTAPISVTNNIYVAKPNDYLSDPINK